MRQPWLADARLRFDSGTGPKGWKTIARLRCKHKNITMEDLSYETEVICEKCGEAFEPI